MNESLKVSCATESTFDEFYAGLVFLVGVWIAGKCVKLVGWPPLVGEITIGLILGPNLIDFVPFPDAFKMIGQLGLVLLVIEAGIDVDLEMLRTIGMRGAAVATSGSLVPLGIGFALASQVFGLENNGSFVVGVAVAPTSMGIAISILRAAMLLGTPTGQVIVAAAVLDDILALVLLSEVENLGQVGDTWAFAQPIVVALCLLIGFGFLAVFVIPKVMHLALERIPAKFHENVALAAIFGIALMLTRVARDAGSSFLLGAFVSGMGFCNLDSAKDVWRDQVKRILAWTLRIFFACTIGFEVPVKEFADPIVIRNSFILLTALSGKIATGFIWARPYNAFNIAITSCAMSSLGEIAFVVLVFGKQENFIDDKIAASIALTILITILVGPIALRCVIFINSRKNEKAKGTAKKLSCVFTQVQSFASLSLQDRVLRAILDAEYEILDFRNSLRSHQSRKRQIVLEAFILDNHDEDLWESRLEELRLSLEAIVDESGNVIVSEEGSFEDGESAFDHAFEILGERNFEVLRS